MQETKDYGTFLISVPPTQEYIDKYRTLRLLALETNPESFSSTYAQEAAFTDNQWLDRLTSPLKRTVIIHDVTGAWIGIVAFLAPNALEGLSLPTPLRCSFSVFQMWVHPDHLGRGIGKRLMVEGLRWAEDWSRANGLKEFYVALEDSA